MATVQLEGVLEVDLDRGVIWFSSAQGSLPGATVLRVCGLPKGLDITKEQHDVTVTDYVGKSRS